LWTPRFSPVPDGLDSVESFAGLEVHGIARGLVATDALVKKAASRVVLANPVSPGKYVILLDGLVADVEESLLEAERIAGDQVIDRFLLPYAHRQLEPSVFGTYPGRPDGAVGIVETATICSGLLSCDKALKAAQVSMLVLHLSVGIGGKCWYAFGGDLFDVVASLKAAAEAAGTRLLATEVIPAPHPEFLVAMGLSPECPS
jgi:microcompartment protein CcmL/EutN